MQLCKSLFFNLKVSSYRKAVLHTFFAFKSRIKETTLFINEAISSTDAKNRFKTVSQRHHIDPALYSPASKGSLRAYAQLSLLLPCRVGIANRSWPKSTKVGANRAMPSSDMSYERLLPSPFDGASTTGPLNLVALVAVPHPGNRRFRPSPCTLFWLPCLDRSSGALK